MTPTATFCPPRSLSLPLPYSSRGVTLSVLTAPSAASSCPMRPFRGFVCPPPLHFPPPFFSQQTVYLLINTRSPPPSRFILRGNCVQRRRCATRARSLALMTVTSAAAATAVIKSAIEEHPASVLVSPSEAEPRRTNQRLVPLKMSRRFGTILQNVFLMQALKSRTGIWP